MFLRVCFAPGCLTASHNVSTEQDLPLVVAIHTILSPQKRPHTSTQEEEEEEEWCWEISATAAADGRSQGHVAGMTEQEGYDQEEKLRGRWWWWWGTQTRCKRYIWL